VGVLDIYPTECDDERCTNRNKRVGSALTLGILKRFMLKLILSFPDTGVIRVVISSFFELDVINISWSFKIHFFYRIAIRSQQITLMMNHENGRILALEQWNTLYENDVVTLLLFDLPKAKFAQDESRVLDDMLG
jgi:hypothetical protein